MAMTIAATVLPNPVRVTSDGGWEPDAYDGWLGALRAAGYHYFELSRTRRLTVEVARAIRERAEGLGLSAVALHAPALHGVDAIERQRESIRAAKALGAPLLVFHVSSLRFAAADGMVRRRARDADRERVTAWAELAGEYGMQVALENASHREHPAYLQELCASLELPNVGVALDTGHANLRGTAAHEVVVELAPLARHTHLHDNHGLRDEHLVPGRGSIRWREVVAALEGAGYGGAWCAELRGQPPARAEQALREAREFLARLRRSAG